MLLKSLELQGFKTFPDKTTLRFEEGITSIVGPNGSGKSNISDAMRWVLGEQSVRTLRCSKMEDVVFSGTPKRKAQGYAEVTLTIDNSDRKLNFENDTVAITRRYYRSGESEYLINKTMVRLKDINELFMDTGLGRDGYSIIGQGKIDSIVAAKSEDRREIFEEAAGISRFRYRKEEAERRINRAEENLVRLRDILSELEDRVEPLRIQAEKAEKFIEYDGEKKELEIGIWVETLNRSGKILREHEEKVLLTKSQHEEVLKQADEIVLQIEKNFREANECTALTDFERGEAARLDEQAVRADGEISVFMNDIAHNEQNIARINEQILLTETSGLDIDKDIFEKQEAIKNKDTEIEESRKKLDSFTEKLSLLRQSADEATREIEEAALEIAALNAKLSEEKILLSSAQSSVIEIGRRDNTVDEALKNAEEKSREFEQEGRDLKAMLDEVEEEISAKQNSVSGYELRLETRRKKTAEKKAEFEKLSLDANEQSRRVKLLEDLERNFEGFAHSVKAVMKEAQRGALHGVNGPVTQIIKVPAKYAVALETALGAAMQNVVVETEQDAKAAISLLKQRDLGRATFLPLTTIKGTLTDKRAMADLPGFVGVAAELCSCEPKFDGVRNSLLGRVAVAENLDSAVNIAKKMGYKFRIVSLDGQVVNAGGSLTGGSKARNSGLLGRAGEIERIREKAAELQKKAEQIQLEYKERQAELSLTEAEIDTAKSELSMLTQDRIKLISECARVTRDIEVSKQESQNLRDEKADSGKRVKELNDSIELSQAKISKLEAQQKEADEGVQSLTGNREEKMARCNDISTTIQEIKLGEFSAQKDKEQLKLAIEDLESRKTDSGGMVVQFRNEIAELKKVSGKLNEQINAHKELTVKLREEAAEKRNSAETLSAKKAELEKAARELREKERETASNRENINGELARLLERSDNFQKEYDVIIAKLWEEYELTRREAEEIGVHIEDVPKAQRRLTELKNKIKALGSVNVGAVVEYKEVSERYVFLKEQVEDVEKSKNELTELISGLTKQMKEQFIIRFGEINSHFISIFRQLFGGGSAQLSLADENDILNSGIEIKVHPPGKIVTHIESLSGGEKALVAISIYFAIMRVSPPPFCVLDEIEASLDDMNVVRFAQYLRKMSKATQFIGITHRRGTMEESDMLYGVTMQDQGMSKLLALKTKEEAERVVG